MIPLETNPDSTDYEAEGTLFIRYLGQKTTTKITRNLVTTHDIIRLSPAFYESTDFITIRSVGEEWPMISYTPTYLLQYIPCHCCGLAELLIWICYDESIWTNLVWRQMIIKLDWYITYQPSLFTCCKSSIDFDFVFRPVAGKTPSTYQRRLQTRNRGESV